MLLTHENYFSKEVMQEYMSVSLYKDFVGVLGRTGCESAACAKLRGEWEEEPTIAMMVGKYVDSHFSGTLDVFQAQNPDIFTKQGELKAQYKKAEEIINRIERDEYMMKFLSGEKQVIMTGELFGAKWKIMVDSLDRELFITDLKVMESITKAYWVRDYGHVSFVQYWNIDIQMSVYQEIVRQNIGKTLPVFLAVATKEPAIDIEILGFMPNDLSDSLSLIQPNIPRILELKEGKAEPDPCGVCGYCRKVKVLSRPIHFSAIRLKI